MTNTTCLRIRAVACAILLLTGLLTAEAAKAQTGAGWTEITAASGGPSARAGHTFTTVGDQAYVFGGLAGSPLNDLWRFDGASGTFVQVEASNPPPARRNHAAAAFAGKLFVFGGLGAGASQFLADVWSFDPSTNAWTEVTSTGLRPEARAFHQVIASGQLIVFGGGFGPSSNGAFVDRWTFDPSTGTWTRLFPAAGKGVVDTNRITDECGRYGVYVFAVLLCQVLAPGADCEKYAADIVYGGESFGDDSKLGTIHSDAYQIDISNGQFKRVETVGDLPPGMVLGATATFRPAAGSIAEKVILVGGELGGGQRSNRTYLVEGEPNEPVLRFSAGPDLPVALSEPAAAYVPDFPFAGRAAGPAVVVFGGRPSGGDDVTARTFVLPAEGARATANFSGEWTTAPTEKCKNNKCRISGTFVVRNDGALGAGAATVSFYLSNDGAFDSSDTLIRTSELPEMEAGSSTTFEFKKKQRIKLPSGVSASGKFVIAVVDPGGLVDEGDEGDNAVAAQVP